MIKVGKEYFTKDGRTVAIYETNGGRQYPILGAIKDGERWTAQSWTEDGLYNTQETSYFDLDLLEELKPCPFCGKDVAKVTDALELKRDNDMEGYYVVCSAREGGCGASSGWEDTKEDVTKQWNRRTK